MDKERIALWSTIDINYSLTAEACVFSVDSGSNRLLEIVCSRYFSLYKRIIYDRLSMILLFYLAGKDTFRGYLMGLGFQSKESLF